MSAKSLDRLETALEKAYWIDAKERTTGILDRYVLCAPDGDVAGPALTKADKVPRLGRRRLRSCELPCRC